MLFRSAFIVILCLFQATTFVYSQTTFHQDMFHGGVTAGGFSTGQGSGSGTVSLYVESGSTIRKAYLFSYTLRYPPIAPITVNGIPYTFDTTLNCIMKVTHLSIYATPIRLYVKDITTDLIASPTNTFNVTIPFQPGLPINAGWYTAFLYIEYENASLPITSSAIIINNQNLIGNENYVINNLNPINTLYPVGFSLYTDRTGGNFAPDEKVYFNSNLLGIIGGSDNINNSWNYAGVKGHFYYQNNQLFGLDDDSANAVMGGTDGLADVSSYLTNNATSCNFQLINILYPNQADNNTNSNLAYFLTYTSPCAPFSVTVPNDTTICQGSALQLNVSGGQSYEWLSPTNSSTGNPAPGLSCTNCPNPIFTADSSMFYTVRIWNNDSCSVVRPVHITVKEPPVLPQLSTLKAQCGVASGSITIKTPKETGELYILSANGDTLVKPIVANQNTNQGGLYAGNYTIYFQDSLGCRSGDTTITIAAINNTVANFTATPQSGGAPLTVHIDNTSQNAQNYSWLLNGVLQATPFNSFVADTSGSYQITLIAWQNDSSCADTATLTVLVYDSLIIGIPNVFTPNSDGINDFFSISTNFPADAQLFIINRWGEEVFSYSGKLTAGDNKLWNGNNVTAGVYFYTLIIDDQASSNCPAGNCQLKKEGFVTVVR